MMKNRIFHWGPITALTIITVLFLTSTVTFLVWCPPYNLSGILHAGIFMIWVFNIFHHFFKAIYLGPGHVPFKWKPEMKEDEECLQYCKPCQGYKAPRSHHCKTCKRCIMKMDHHCPWINNCVGHYNHRSFTLFLFFVMIGCLHAVCLMVFAVYDHMVWRNGMMLLRVDPSAPLRMNKYIMIAILFGIGLSTGVTIAVGILLFYQIKSIMKNETSIESWIIEKAKSRSREEGDVFIFPYDIGMFENLKQVLFCWSDFVGDGIDWVLFEGCDKYALTVEQIEQKFIKRDNIVTFKVSRDYSGSWFPISYGVRVCWSAPWTEEDRLDVRTGDTVNATRIRRHWVFGELINDESAESVHVPLGESLEKKGWLPRCCVEEFIAEGVTILRKKKNL